MSAPPVTPAPSRPRRRWIWITVAALTAAVTVLPVLARIWLKTAHQNQAVPTAVYRQPISKLRVDAPGTMTATIGTGQLAVTYPPRVRP